MASLLFERNRVTQLEKDLQNKDQALKSLMMDGEPGSSRRDSRESSRLRHDSASSEVGRILGSPDTDLMLQNERLQYDLDSSVGERRALSQQMQNWKRQLTQADQGSDVDSESEDFVRMKQEQAYRSVGALQLRVEELTLEVTKVSQLIISRSKIKFRISGYNIQAQLLHFLTFWVELLLTRKFFPRENILMNLLSLGISYVKKFDEAYCFSDRYSDRNA